MQEASPTALAFYRYAARFGFPARGGAPDVTMSEEKYHQVFESLPLTWRWCDGRRDDLHFMLKGVIFRPI